MKTLWRETLTVAISAALDAGRYFASRLDTEKTVKTKSSPSDLVTEVDPECERRIRAHIERAFPDHEVLGEETTAPGAEASIAAAAKYGMAPHLWIVDPIDGTTNFVQRIPLSVVSIAYAEGGEVVLGVIYDPYRDELFYGVKGEGAHVANGNSLEIWLKTADAAEADSSWPGKPISVSDTVDYRRCVVATGFPSRGEYRALATAAAFHVVERVKSLRNLGAAALHLAYVASGRMDGFWEYELNSWDIAAGALLIQEAGGVCRELGKSGYSLSVRNVVAAGRPELADELERNVLVANGK